jgi:hypothetical protein
MIGDLPDIREFLDRRSKRPDVPTLDAVPVDVPAAASSSADIRDALFSEMERLVNGEIEAKTANAIADRAADHLKAIAEAAKVQLEGARTRRSRQKGPVTIELTAERAQFESARPVHPLCELFPPIEGSLPHNAADLRNHSTSRRVSRHDRQSDR